MNDPWNRDQWNLICKRQNTGNLDGGDSAANEATYIFCSYLLNGEFDPSYPMRVFDQLEYAPGHWRRHPDTTKWYAQPGMDRWSRDQSIPVLCALALTDTNRARRWYDNHKTRFFLFMPNTGYKNGVYAEMPGNTKKKLFGDPTLFEYFSILIRACRSYNKFWMLRFLDFELFLGSVFRKFFSRDRDVRNHILSLILSNTINPTLLSRLALKITDPDRLMSDVIYWFSERSPGEPPMDDVLIPLIDKYWGREYEV